MRRKRIRWRLLAATVAGSMLLVAGPVLPAMASGGANLATGKTAAASSAAASHKASVINDGDQGTYWESRSSALPEWAQLDLGTTRKIDRVVLRLPAEWQARTQTLAVQGSADGKSFATLAQSAGQRFAPGAGNAVTIDFPATQTRFVRVEITANTGSSRAQLGEVEAYSAGDSSVNLARDRKLTASSTTDSDTARNAGDGNRTSYWESESTDFAQWLQADLGAAVRVNKVVLRLPESWDERTQQITVQGSTNGKDGTDLVASAAYRFAPADDNTVTITFDTTTTRYVRLTITANTGRPAGQLSEFEVYGPASGDTQAPTAPGNLAYAQPATGQIQLTWNASTRQHRRHRLRHLRQRHAAHQRRRATSPTYTDNQPADATVTYYVKATDAAGNQSGRQQHRSPAPGATGDTQAPTRPGDLAYTAARRRPDQADLERRPPTTWASRGYDIYANGTLRASVAGNVTDLHRQPAGTAPRSPTTCGPRTRRATSRPTSNTVTRNGTGDRRRPTSPSASRSRASARRVHVRGGQRQRQQR